MVKRYDAVNGAGFSADIFPEEQPDGEFVFYEDYERLEDALEAEKDLKAKAREQRDQLAARIKRIRTAYRDKSIDDANLVDMVADILNESPAASLAEHDAELLQSILYEAEEVRKQRGNIGYIDFLMSEAMTRRLNQIRQQAQEGE